mgnify:CR=1 FL=1
MPAIPRLLVRLDIEGAVVSIDAAGTQMAIAVRILEGNAHYFLAVKDNQPSLREAVLSRWPGIRTVVEVTSTVTTPEGTSAIDSGQGDAFGCLGGHGHGGGSDI